MEYPDQFSPPPTVAPVASAGLPTVDVLPTMADLDRLSADLDMVDETLADLDRDVVADSGS